MLPPVQTQIDSTAWDKNAPKRARTHTSKLFLRRYFCPYIHVRMIDSSLFFLFVFWWVCVWRCFALLVFSVWETCVDACWCFSGFMSSFIVTCSICISLSLSLTHELRHSSQGLTTTNHRLPFIWRTLVYLFITNWMAFWVWRFWLGELFLVFFSVSLFIFSCFCGFIECVDWLFFLSCIPLFLNTLPFLGMTCFSFFSRGRD